MADRDQQPKKPIETYREVSFQEMVAEGGFTASGFARIKVTKPDGVRIVTVPITSMPEEDLANLRKQAPKPPTKPYKDPQTRAVSLVQDFSDPTFMEKSDAHGRMIEREVVGRCVLLDVTNRDGSPASTPDQKYEGLLRLGLTQTHLAEVATAILRLTQFTDEEREKFL